MYICSKWRWVLQVTQELGRSVVRAVGYIEKPRESLAVIMEPSENSVMQLVKDDYLNAEFSVCISDCQPVPATLLRISSSTSTSDYSGHNCAQSTSSFQPLIAQASNHIYCCSALQGWMFKEITTAVGTHSNLHKPQVSERLHDDKLAYVCMQMNLAQWTATTLTALHSKHIMHAAFSPAALRYSSLHSRHHDANDAPQGAQGSFVSRALPRHSRNGSGDAGAVQQGDELRVMLSDFSCATALVGPDFKTTNGRSCTAMGGMAEYFAAPERQRATSTLCIQSDTWSYAMTMYYLLTGLDPNAMRNLVTDRRHRHSNLLTGGETPDAREKSSGAPRELFYLLAECMNVDPEQRPCMQSIAQRIQGIIDDGTFQNGRFVYRGNSQRRNSGRAQHSGGRPPQGYPNHAVPDQRGQYGAQQLAADMQGAHISPAQPSPDRHQGAAPQRNGSVRHHPNAQPQYQHQQRPQQQLWQAPDRGRQLQLQRSDARNSRAPQGPPPEQFYGHQQAPPGRGQPPGSYGHGPGSNYPPPQLLHHQQADNRYPPGCNYNQRRV